MKYLSELITRIYLLHQLSIFNIIFQRMKGKQNTIKSSHSSSIHKKGQKGNSNSKAKNNMKARQQQALKKFNKTIHELKKPNNRVFVDNFQPSCTVRSKSPSPLQQIKLKQANTNLQSVFSMKKNTQFDIKQLKCSKIQRGNDQNFIEDLFNGSMQKSQNKKKEQNKFTNGNLIEQMISKIIVKNNSKKEIGQTKKRVTQSDVNRNSQLQAKVKELENQVQFFSKTISQKDCQIKNLNEKIGMYEQHCQIFTLNTFEAVAVFKKLDAQKESLNIDLYSAFLQTRMNKLIADINFFVEKLKLQGKIRLKGHILQKQLNEAFAGRGRAYTQDSRFPVQNNLEINKGQNNRQLCEQKINQQQHFRSRSSQPASKKNEGIQILIDILSRRDSIPSSRKQCKDEQKASVTKRFPGLIQAHQLVLNKGDIITILKKNENGWWIGMKQGIVGYFPSDCIKSL